ncbi:MAG: hypothetical protein ACOYL5_13635 [Phototrophicaceae bacterium]|jgi:hypothetical protein
MNQVVFFIEWSALGWYLFIIGGVLISLWGWSQEQVKLRETYFELERNLARSRRSDFATFVILLIEAALIILGFQRVIAPYVRAQADLTAEILERPDDLPFATPTARPTTGGVIIDDSAVRDRIEATDPGAGIALTPTLTPTPVGTIIANPGEVIGCDTDNAYLQVPANGMVVFTPMNVIGKAYVDNFAFYRFELRGVSTFDQFAPLAEYSQPVTEQTSLGQFVPSSYEPGEYQFRLNVFDITNNVQATCTVNIIISDPIPTPTPLPVTG